MSKGFKQTLLQRRYLNGNRYMKRYSPSLIITLLPPGKPVCRSEGNSQNWTGSKLGRSYVKAVYCHPAYLTYMQSTSCEISGWMKHKLKPRLLGEISITPDMEMTHPNNKKQRGTKEPLDER